MKPPKLVTLLPEEEEDAPQPPKTPTYIGAKLVMQIASVVVLKVATGIAIRNLTRTIREMDILYPEHLSKVNWKEQQDEEGS